MNLNFEKTFTLEEYERFAKAVKNFEEYSFQLGDYKAKMQVRITGRKCDNGIWEPENYLWSIDMEDNRAGYSGHGCPYRVSELKLYPEIISEVYRFFKIDLPQIVNQLSFF